MKWLFFLLLLINIGMFVWIYPQQPQPQPEPTHLPGVKRLVLLGEANQTSGQSGQLSEMDRALEREAENPLDRGATPVQGQSRADDPGVVPELSSDTRYEAGTPTDQEPQTEVRDPTDAAGSTPKSERSSDQVGFAPPRQCRRIGPIAKRNQVDKLSLSLMAMGIQTELQTESTEEQEGYWVMIPPQENREAATAIVKRLREAGITDLWRFTSGSFANAISLGLFRNESRAEIRRKAIATKGFDAEVKPRYRQKNAYWLAFSYSGDSPLTETDWNSIAEIYPGVEQLYVDCAVVGKR